jgi:hypothetical protein
MVHPLLAPFCFSSNVALARDVAAGAFRRTVFPERAHRLARDHLAVDRGIDGDLEELSRDQVLSFSRRV